MTCNESLDKDRRGRLIISQYIDILIFQRRGGSLVQSHSPSMTPESHRHGRAVDPCPARLVREPNSRIQDMGRLASRILWIAEKLWMGWGIAGE
jgi:hypothetical protein